MIPSNHLILCCPLLPLPSIFPSIRVFSNESARWERLTKLKLGLVLMGGAMLSKYLIPCSVDGWSCVPSLLFTWDQTMVQEIKTMATSFKRSHACTAKLSDPDTEAGQHQPMPPLQTLGHSQASLGQSFVGSLLISPGSLCAHSSVCAFQESISQSCVSSGSSMVGLMATSSKRAYAIPKYAVPSHTHVWCTLSVYPCGNPLLNHISTGNTQTVQPQSLWSLGPGAHKVCLSPLSSSGRNGVSF